MGWAHAGMKLRFYGSIYRLSDSSASMDLDLPNYYGCLLDWQDDI